MRQRDYPLIRMHLRCIDWKVLWPKQRLQKCPNGQVTTIFARSPKTRIFWKSAKGGPSEIFQKSPQKKPSFERAKSTVAQIASSSNHYALKVQRLDKILAHKAAPKLPQRVKLWQLLEGHPKAAFSKKVQRGDQGKFFKNRLKTSPRLKGPKVLWRKLHSTLFSIHL